MPSGAELKVEILREVRPMVVDGTYICYSLFLAYQDNPLWREACFDLQYEIMAHIHPHSTYIKWYEVKNKIQIPVNAEGHYRQRFVDELIAKYETQSD